MGNSSSSSVDHHFTSASRAFTQKKLDDLKSLFVSLASKSQSNDQYVSYPVFQEYFGLSGSLGERMFDMVTQHRKDDKLTFEDLVIAKATYEKGTDDEIAEFIYQTLDVNGNGVLTRLLVCHDMKGGYVDDKWVQGCGNNAGYAIWDWYLMDVFVYFSHSLVTLPPPCWTNTAHRHGVKVLGTFITEWDKGKATCKELLATNESAQMYAERLAEFSAALGFDGWLINIENIIDEVQIPNLMVFVSHLTKVIHSSVPGGLVIWYDSVTVDGQLAWQDQLTEKNKPFFDICDGIFMNYTWKENYPKASADIAGDRKYDVYMGIDVFGRGTYGGGQWTANVALDLLKSSDVSAAVFASGWVYETEQPPDFRTAQNKWWSLVEKSWGIVQTYPQVQPFYSDFNQALVLISLSEVENYQTHPGTTFHAKVCSHS